MGLHQFNKDKKLLKLKFNNNKNKYFKLMITMISIVLIIFTIVYFSYSKYSETNKYNVIQSTVGDFSKTKNLVDYLTSIQANNTSTMYYDGTTDNNLRYYGSNPNNYITFNGELWRIIGVMNNMTTSDGKSAPLVKIIRANSIGNYSASNTNSNEWTTTSLYNILNNYYYNKTSGTCYLFNGNTSSIGVVSTTCNFSTNGLSADAKKLIQGVVWKLGGEPYPGNYTTSTYYSGERSTTVYSGHSTTWTGNIGLIYPSDYGYATAGGTTSNKATCLGYNLYSWNTYSDCYNNDFLNTNNVKWTMTPLSSHSTDIYTVQNTGNIFWGTYWTYSNNEIYPSLYLNSNVLLNGGNGTSSSPYTIMNPVNTFDYTGGEQTFTVPTDGYYNLEAWGAGAPGLGGYTSGSVYLTANTNLYINVGGTGGNINYSDLSSGGYNGGGYGAVATFSGGGATDFRLTSANLYSRIMVAGGAGGKGNYTNSSTYGGYGGGIDGGAGYLASIGSTQVSGASFGNGIGGHSNNGCGGAGGGYYGGSYNCSSTSMYAGGGGGSAFVSGYTGCVAITSSSSLTPRLDSKGVQCTEASAASDITCSYHYSGYIFKNGIIKTGNTVMPTHDGTSTMTGNSGNGYAKITYIGTSLK